MKEHEVLTKYLTDTQLHEVLYSWRDAGYSDVNPRVAELLKAIESLNA